MRIASTTISEAKMKTWLAESVVPWPTSAKPAQTRPLDQLGQDQPARPQVDVDLGPRRRQEAAAELEQHNLREDHQQQPDDRLADRRPEHRGEREDDGQQLDGGDGAELVAHEHRQQLVLELGLDCRALHQPLARLAQGLSAPLLVRLSPGPPEWPPAVDRGRWLQANSYPNGTDGSVCPQPAPQPVISRKPNPVRPMVNLG